MTICIECGGNKVCAGTCATGTHPKKAEPIECQTCRGAGGTTQDAWSYGDSRGRGEGHYTIDHDCPCCDGEGSFQSPQEAEEHRGHDGSEHEPDPGEPPEPDIDDRDHVKEEED